MGCINYMMPSNDEKQTATICYDMPCQYIILYQTKPRAGISAALFFGHGSIERCSCWEGNQWLCLAFRWWWNDVAHSPGQCYDRHGTCLEMALIDNDRYWWYLGMALTFVVWSPLLARLCPARCTGLATRLRSGGMGKTMKSIFLLFVRLCGHKANHHKEVL